MNSLDSMKIMATDRAALLAILERFHGRHVTVLGDLVADESLYGEIARISREAPVLILKQREKQVVPGGGANAANNLADLGAQVIPVGVVGDDEAGEALLRYFREKQVSTRHVIRVRNRLTPTKTRILGGLTHWQRQQIVRVDREPTRPLATKLRTRVTHAAAATLTTSTGLLVSDYGYGATNAEQVDLVRRQLRHRPLPITVDSRYDLWSYKHLTAATPNEPELESAFGQSIGHDLDRLHTLGKKFLHRQSLKALLVTRGSDGMVLFEPRRAPCHIPIVGSDQAVDVTGAGDTVIAVFTLALAARASFLESARLANFAGGLVVMKRGTATITHAELSEAVRNA